MFMLEPISHWAQVKQFNDLLLACFNRFWIRICRTKLQPTFSESGVDSPGSFPPTGNRRQGGFTEWVLGTLPEDEARSFRPCDKVQRHPRSNQVGYIYQYFVLPENERIPTKPLITIHLLNNIVAVKLSYNEHSVITNRYKGQIDNFTTQINQVITNTNGRSRAVHYSRVWLYIQIFSPKSHFQGCWLGMSSCPNSIFCMTYNS